jgi:sugar-specific transcriptional regulator TrmB
VGRAGADLRELLTDHGVPEKAARLYLAACRTGPQTASELARLTAIHRVEAYRAIQSLVADGLLSAAGSRPRRFVALAPDRLLDRWISGAAERLRVLEHDRARILDDWESGRVEPEEVDPRKFTVLDGREAVRRFLKRRIGQASREILISATGPWLASMIDGGVDRALGEAQARGVRIRLVTEVARPNLVEAKHFASKVALRHSRVPVSNRAVVVDSAGAMVYVSGDDGLGRAPEAQVALWSPTPAFVALARDYHRRLWTTAERAEVRFVELEEPSSAALPVVVGKEAVPFQRLKEIAALGMRASGVREFRLDLPELIGTIARQLGREIAEEVEGQTVGDVTKNLARYYASHTMGRLAVERERPLTLRVTGCFACTPSSTEIGREMCPQLLRAVLETRLGSRWVVTKPDPTKHASRGCLFTASPA